jgi:hypothetical protein
MIIYKFLYNVCLLFFYLLLLSSMVCHNNQSNAINPIEPIDVQVTVSVRLSSPWVFEDLGEMDIDEPAMNSFLTHNMEQDPIFAFDDDTTTVDDIVFEPSEIPGQERVVMDVHLYITVNDSQDILNDVRRMNTIQHIRGMIPHMIELCPGEEGTIEMTHITYEDPDKYGMQIESLSSD